MKSLKSTMAQISSARNPLYTTTTKSTIIVSEKIPMITFKN